MPDSGLGGAAPPPPQRKAPPGSFVLEPAPPEAFAGVPSEVDDAVVFFQVCLPPVVGMWQALPAEDKDRWAKTRMHTRGGAPKRPRRRRRRKRRFDHGL